MSRTLRRLAITFFAVFSVSGHYPPLLAGVEGLDLGLDELALAPDSARQDRLDHRQPDARLLEGRTRLAVTPSFGKDQWGVAVALRF